jgi:hypothetical protein
MTSLVLCCLCGAVVAWLNVWLQEEEMDEDLD